MDSALIDPSVRLLTVRYARLDQWRFADISSPFWRFYWNPRAVAEIRLEGVVTRLCPGSVYLIPPETPCSTRNWRPMDHFYAHFTAAPPYSRVAPRVFEFDADRNTLRRLGRLCGLLEESPGTVSIAAETVSLVCQALARIPPALLTVPHFDPRIMTAIEAIAASTGEPLSNRHLAAQAHMNTNAFIRLFRKQMGVSPAAYGRACRIEKACALLHDPAMGIKDIAAATGFADRYHFSRVFRQCRGMGPARFRAQTLLLQRR